MSQQYGRNIGVCATCDFWGGKRECKQWGDHVEIGSPMDMGECYSAESGWRGKGGTQACSKCAHWQAWCALRKR